MYKYLSLYIYIYHCLIICVYIIMNFHGEMWATCGQRVGNVRQHVRA